MRNISISSCLGKAFIYLNSNCSIFFSFNLKHVYTKKQRQHAKVAYNKCTRQNQEIVSHSLYELNQESLASCDLPACLGVALGRRRE